MGLALNRLVRDGEISAPIVIGRDHLDAGSVASPNRETESMKDGSDAVGDWAVLNALLTQLQVVHGFHSITVAVLAWDIHFMRVWWL